MRIRDLKLAALAGLLFIGASGVVKAEDVSTYSELNTAITNGTTPIHITADITGADSNLGTLGGNIVIDGNGHTISGSDGSSSYTGFFVNTGQSLTINNTTISEFNKETSLGAAISNLSTLNLNGVTFTKTNGTSNDIYQEDTGTTVLTGTNNIASNISGHGSITNSGDLTISGSNAGYTGTYTQTAGSTTVTGRGFGGKTTISGGSLNWQTDYNPSTAIVNVTGGTLTIGADANQQAALNISNKSSIADTVNVTVNQNSSLNISGTGAEAGQVTLNTDDTWNGIINVSGDGSLTVDGVSNGKINATGGTVDIKSGTLALGTGSTIAGAATVKIESGATLESNAGNTVTINNSDTWAADGTLHLNGGTVNIEGRNQNGFVNAESGNLKLNSGSLEIGTGSLIKDTVNTTIAGGSTLKITGTGNVTLNSGDTWAGDVTLTSGSLTVGMAANATNGKLTASGGSFTVTGGKVDLIADSTIDAGVTTVIDTTGTLNIAGGTANLDSGDTWSGNIKLSDGSLNLDSVTQGTTATLNATNGALNLNAGTLTIGTNSSVADAVATKISNNTTIDVTVGTVNINNNDEWAANGKINLDGGTLNISGRDKTKGNGIITAGAGNLNLNSGHLVIAEKSNIDNAVKTVIAKDSNLDIKSGDVELNANDNWSGTVDLSAGNLTLTNAVNKGILKASGGNVNIEKGTLNIAKDSVIDENATVNIDANTNLSIEGGTVSLDQKDTWSGNVLLTDGILNLNKTDNGVLKASGGELNLNDGTLTIGEGSSIATGTKLSIAEDKTLDIIDKGFVAIGDDDNWQGNVLLNGGTLDYGATSQDAHNLTANKGNLNLLKNSYLTVGGSSTLADAVATKISSGATLDVNVGDGSVITLDSGDSWIGTVKVTTGTLALNNVDPNGIINAVGGVVDLQAGNLKVASGSVISNDATTKIAADTNLAVTGGNVTLNDKTEWSGNVILTNGNLTLNDVQNNGVIQAVNGNLNLDKGLLTVGENSFINGDVVAAIKEDTTLDIIDKGVVQIDRNDKWKGQISLNGGTLNYNADSNALLTADSGDLNLLAGSTFVFENGSQVADKVNVDIQKDAIVNIQNDGHLNLDTADKWNGIINISDGILTTTDFTNFTGSGGGLRQTGGQAIFKDNSHIYISDKTSFINGGEVQILNNSSLNYGAGASKFVADTLVMSDNSLLNLSNAALDQVVVNNSATINGTNHLTIDISPRDWKADNFVFNDVKSDSNGTINISDFNFIGLAPIDRHIKLRIFDVKSVQNVNFDSVDKEIFTPIGWYDLKATGGGYYTSNLVRYNPQVFRGQVATLAMYNNQLAIDDMILNHVALQSERFLANGQNANKYAINQSSFAPYQYSKEDGGLWFKSYANFEHLSMNQGLRVGNNAYGSILGADFPMVHLKKGWEFLPTAFIAYNGSHQHFDGVGMYQNGGQAGFMGTFMKDDFVGSLMAYGGGYTNEMNVAGFTDKTGNWFAGAAAKAAYNLHATKHFTVQPTLMAAYNAFGENGWHTDFGTMHMNTSMLNGISVAPGINLIYARETWSLYTTIQYLYNINDNLTARAGNVNLHHIEMKHGYIQYGFGATKTWKDRLNSFFQITFRNGGRTGVGFQLGFQYLCDWYKPGRKIQGPTVLKSIKMANETKNGSTQEVKHQTITVNTMQKTNLDQTTKTSGKAVIKAL